ncbi:MAG: hypothetical protein Q9172_001761 [Xanthocarpia lactea]
MAAIVQLGIATACLPSTSTTGETKDQANTLKCGAYYRKMENLSLFLPSMLIEVIVTGLLIRLRSLLDYDSNNVNTLFRCNDNQWCCSRGGNETSCCNDPDVISFDVPQVERAARIFNGSAFAPGYALVRTDGSTASGAATEPTSTVTINGDTCPTVDGSGVTCPAPSTNDDGDATMRVGVGVGVGIGVPLLFALATTFYALFREKQRSLEFQKQAAVATQQFRRTQQFGREQPDSGSGVHEMRGRMGDDGAKELVGSEGWREMNA